MKNNWSMYVAGVGSSDAASDMLTSFVGELRDTGLKINDVQLMDGTLHPDLNAVETGEDGWTLSVYGEGDVSIAYNKFPTLLRQFQDAGYKITQSGVIEGALRNVPIPA